MDQYQMMFANRSRVESQPRTSHVLRARPSWPLLPAPPAGRCRAQELAETGMAEKPQESDLYDRRLRHTILLRPNSKEFVEHGAQ